MKIQKQKIAALTLSVFAAIYFLLSGTASGYARNVCSEELPGLDTVMLGESGYYILSPAGYHLRVNEPYPGYVSDAEDLIHPMFCFFPDAKDSVCRTRLLIQFDNKPSPKTGYPKGSEFWIDTTVLGTRTSFLDHAICERPFRSRSATVLLSENSYLKIICEAGDTAKMKELFGMALSMQRK